nr:RNA-directed DNA polymerase, eukaryota, reverse transcriptase zinc-binding domain protein [Tanacetum cinerariifolium]
MPDSKPYSRNSTGKPPSLKRSLMIPPSTPTPTSLTPEPLMSSPTHPLSLPKSISPTTPSLSCLHDTDDDNSMDTESRDEMPKGEDLRKVVEPDDDSDLEIANVIKSIHGDQEKIGKKATASFQSIWLDIVKEVDVLKKTCLNILRCIHKKLANGSDTLFLEDAWHGDIAFKDLFPRVYALESCTNIDVASKLYHSNLAFSFRRDPRGGVEQVQFDLLMTKVAGISLVNMREKWIWSLEGSGDFYVDSVRKLIDNHTLLNIATRTRWIKEVLIKDVIIRVIGATY